MPLTPGAHLRIARPCRDLAAARRFWAEGLGMHELYRHTPGPTQLDAEYALLMVGFPGAAWHLELARDAAGTTPTPTDEDLLVLYLDEEPVPPELLARLEQHGGTRVPARNPYWDTWGVTVEDPDGYRLVLSTRQWSNG